MQFRHLARFHKTMLRAEVLRDAVSSVFFYVYYIYIYIYIHTLFQPWEWEIPSKYLLYQGLFGKSSTSMGNFPAIFDDRNGHLGPRKNQWPAD